MNPQRPPQSMNQQKVRVSNQASFLRFALVGLGFGAVDIASKFIFGEGKHLKYANHETKKDLSTTSKTTTTENAPQNKPKVEFSKEELTARISSQLGTNIDALKLQETANAQNDSIMKNAIFGFISANFGSIFHAKLNALFRKKNYKASYKMAVSPFSFLPYYIFCGLYDHLPLSELLSRITKDALPLFIIRIAGDYVRHRKFSVQEQQAIAQGAQFVSSPRLLAFHMICRGVYIFALDTLYHKRVEIF